MSTVKRIYVEKKLPYAVRAKELKEELKDYLGLTDITGVRVLVRYDVENIDNETYKKALNTVFAEAPMDDLYEETFPVNEGDKVFSVAYLAGQFDQRADSCEQCIRLLNESAVPVVRTATTYVLQGGIKKEELEAVKKYVINPVDSNETDEVKPDTLIQKFDDPADVHIFDGFRDMSDDDFCDLYDSLGLAMTYKDFVFIRDYFRNEEKRDPSMTEIRVLDTYWSDHCRHTTFSTELTDIKFREGYYRKPIEDTFNRYKDDFKVLYKDRNDKYVCLMDLAIMGMKKLRAEGKLEDMEVSDEINACSIIVPVPIEKDGKTETEEWLIFFKNETHNHPTEIEPFGGAATCLGGAIRDPLSGRGYVYQAMRVTGAADPTKPLSETLPGKLPQRKLTTGAASGYSSYGNQIGLATGLVDEIYHPDYVAKRMEIGAVMGAAPRKNVKRENSDPGDVIILMGGRTGRDGCGGATGSSKKHTTQSINTCGAEVQKGNPPTERKLQRLFRREEAAHLIKKCNDFGAGGVSVAIGELAAGLEIDLDKVPKKYAGLDGTELAISESQERMAIVVDPKDVDRMLELAEEENLEAVVVATVTENPRLHMTWRGKTIVDISRAFLDTNGAHQETVAIVPMPDENNKFFDKKVSDDTPEAKKATWLATVSDLNVCGKKGLVEMFDSSIGAATVTMPYGGKYQLTPIQTMTAKLPMSEGDSKLVTMMSYGYDPYLSSWSPYHGSAYAVIESVAKIVAAGGDYKKIRFTFQEYFKRLGNDPERWGAPLAALLGAYRAQLELGLPSIGGKDSMSGSFNDIDVPPTLVSFAVDTAMVDDVVTPEFKNTDSTLILFRMPRDEYDMPDFASAMKMYDAVHALTGEKKIISAYALGGHGIIEAVSKMGFGNKIGAKLCRRLTLNDATAPLYGSVIAEVPEKFEEEILSACEYAEKVGHTVDTGNFEWCAGGGELSMSIPVDEVIDAWMKPVEKVFPTRSSVQKETIKEEVPAIRYEAKNIIVAKNRIARPNVFIPVFPGTNCEYDSAKSFELAGANVKTVVFKNMTEQNIADSVAEFEKAIKEAQIIMFPGGFSAGDEPDGSGKFIATAFRNPRLSDAVNDLLKNRDGLALGICNGFQAIIKLGLVPYGEVREQTEDSPTLARNNIGRHISKSVYTKVVSNNSPGLAGAELGGVYAIPASHGEGKFVASAEWLEKLKANGQIATQYVDVNGNPTMDEDYNVNGSYWAIEGITSPDG
ncbi:MAG: phosphoribosylformylglycinamidine synthase, partial [Lachnospiraceae bacterium]|nr:phosphoribosylformylglycinamidine synthase [Lachnospiraceae bacterium]